MEIAVVMLDGTVAFHSLVNPGIPIPEFIAGLTGIDAKMVRHAPTFDAIVDQLLAALEGCVFVAHNARFDWAFVSTEIERATDCCYRDRGSARSGSRVNCSPTCRAEISIR